MSTGVIAINVEEGAHAYRVNGVTVAKRHLKKAFPTKADQPEKLLWSYLAIVPFLHQAFDLPIKASEQVKYCAAKAHRVFHALRLEEAAILPFMVVAMKCSGDLDEAMLAKIGVEGAMEKFMTLTDPFAPAKPGAQEGNVVQFPGSKKTLH